MSFNDGISRTRVRFPPGPPGNKMYKEIFGPEWIVSLPDDMKQDLLAGKPIVLGSKIYRVCDGCRKVIQVNKSLFGSLHFC